MWHWISGQLTACGTLLASIPRLITSLFLSVLRVALNPTRLGARSWIRFRALWRVVALCASIIGLVAFVISVFSGRGHVVLSDVHLAGNINRKLVNQPMSASALLQELLGRLSNTRSPHDTLERVKKIIRETDFYQDLRPWFWIDQDLSYQTGEAFLKGFEANLGELNNDKRFQKQLPGLDGEIKVFDVALRANDLQRWYERNILGRDLAHLEIYSLGKELIASVSTDTGRVWRVTEYEAQCFDLNKQSTKFCDPTTEKPELIDPQNRSIGVRLSSLINALAQRILLTSSKPDLEHDWIGSAFTLMAMRNLDEALETSRPALIDTAIDNALRALTQPTLTSQTKYLTLLTLLTAYFKKNQVLFESMSSFNGTDTVPACTIWPDSRIVSISPQQAKKLSLNSTEVLKRSIHSQSSIRFTSKDSISDKDLFDRISKNASETLDSKVHLELLLIQWHARMRGFLVSLCNFFEKGESDLATRGIDLATGDIWYNPKIQYGKKLIIGEQSLTTEILTNAFLVSIANQIQEPRERERLRTFIDVFGAQYLHNILETKIWIFETILLQDQITNKKYYLDIFHNEFEVMVREVAEALRYYQKSKNENKSVVMLIMADIKSIMMIYRLKDFNDRHKFGFYGTKDDIKHINEVLNDLINIYPSVDSNSPIKSNILYWLSWSGWSTWKTIATAPSNLKDFSSWKSCVGANSENAMVALVQLSKLHPQEADRFLELTRQPNRSKIDENTASNLLLQQGNSSKPFFKCYTP